MKDLNELKRAAAAKENWIRQKEDEIFELEDTRNVLMADLDAAIMSEDEQKVITIQGKLETINASINAKKQILDAKRDMAPFTQDEVVESEQACISDWNARITDAENQFLKAEKSFYEAYAEMAKVRNNALRDRRDYLELLGKNTNESVKGIIVPREIRYISDREAVERMSGIVGMNWSSVAKTAIPYDGKY